MPTGMEYLEQLQRVALQARYGPDYAARLEEERAFLASKEQKQWHEARQNSIVSGFAKLQQKLKRAVPSTDDVKDNLAIMREAEESRRRVSERNYSQLESPFFMDVIEEARLRVEAGYQQQFDENPSELAAEGKNYPSLFQKVIIGSLSDVAFGASAVRVPDTSDYIITMNAGLPQLLSRFSRIFTRLGALVPVEKFERIDFAASEWRDQYGALAREALAARGNEYVLRNFAGAVGDYFGVDLGVKYDHTEFFGPDLMISEAKTISSEVFIIAHEYAHILDGHHVNGWRELGIVKLAKTVQVGAFAKEVEFAADVVAARILLTPLRNLAASAPQERREMMADSLLGGMVHFFTTAKVVEFMQVLLSRRPAYASYHPPIDERITLLADLLSGASYGRLPHNIGRSFALAGVLIEGFQNALE